MLRISITYAKVAKLHRVNKCGLPSHLTCNWSFL